MENSLVVGLPKEILNIIFRYLNNKSDIQNCRLVCTLWNSTIFSLYYLNGIKVNLPSHRVSLFQKDITKNSALANIINQINITSLNKDPEALSICLKRFKFIIQRCINLIKLEFSTYDFIVIHYLDLLANSNVIMPNIQEIHVSQVDYYPDQAVRRFYLQANFIYCDTITSLEIHNLNDPGFLENYGGLNSYISNFSNLKSLKLHSHSNDIIDISALLDSCNSTLESLFISGGNLSRVGTDIALFISTDWLHNVTHNSLTVLKLKVFDISVNTLEYMMKKLSKIDQLKITVNNKLHNYQNSSYNQDEAMVLMEDFSLYCDGIKNIDISIEYSIIDEETIYFIRNTKKREFAPPADFCRFIEEDLYDTYAPYYMTEGRLKSRESGLELII